MKRKLALMLAVLALILSGCGYMLVEEGTVQVGSPSVKTENTER